MLWICLALLGIIGCICVHRLKTIQKKSIILEVAPSDALIDRIMPAEIMEHILSFVDARGSYECRIVSKYWLNFANTCAMKKIILENAINRMTLADGITADELEEGPAAWKDYEESYPVNQRLHDFAIAQKYNRELLELKSYTMGGLRRIHNLGENKYIVKSTAQKLSLLGTFTTNIIAAPEFYCSLRFDARSDRWTEDPRAVCEIMFDLSDYVTNTGHTKLILCRPINRTRYFSALPLNTDLFRVLFYLLAPVLCYDLSRMPVIVDLFHEWVPWMVLCCIFIINILLSKVLLENDLWNQLAGYGIIAMIAIGTIVAHPYSLQCFEFIGQLVLVFAYIKLLSSYAFPNGLFNAILHDGFCRKRIQILSTAIALNALMLDWSIISQRISDGSLIYQLLINAAYVCVPVLNLVLLDTMRKSTVNRKIELTTIIPWPQRGFTELQFFGALVIVTLMQCRQICPIM